MSHEQASELLAVYVLDAVIGAEREQIEEHLSGCPRCRAEVDAHREVAAALGNSVEPLPEGLWSNISSRLPERHDSEPPPMPQLVREGSGDGAGKSRFQRSRSARPTHAPARSRSSRSSGPSRVSRVSRGRMATALSVAAAAAAVAVVLGVNLVHADDQVTQLQGAIGGSFHTAVVAALDTPGHTVVNLDSATHHRVAQFVMIPDGRGYLVKTSLPALSSGKTYQLWGDVGGRAISLGLMGQSPSHVTFTLAGTRRPTGLAITVEPARGALVHSEPMVAVGAV